MMLTSRLAKRAASPIPAPVVFQPTQAFDGNDGPWSSFPIQIGTPPQVMRVLPSTKSSQTWVILPLGCSPSDPLNCTVSRGGVFDPNISTSWVNNTDTGNSLFPLSLDSNLGYVNEGAQYGFDTVTLGEHGSGGPTLDQQAVAGLATKGFYLGLFGLYPEASSLPQSKGPLPDYVSMLNQSGLIPSLTWSYSAGNQYRPGYGSLILGGYDASRFEPNDVSFTVDGGNFTVNIGAIFLKTGNNTTELVNTPNDLTIAASIDSTTPWMWLPQNVCEQFEQAFGITWNTDVGAYLVNDTLNSALHKQNTSVVLNLGNSSTVPGQGFNITLPYAAFDLVAGPPLLTNSSRYFPLMRANESQYTLGRTFLQEAYLIADYERNNFSVSQCTWGTGTTSHIVAIKSLHNSTPPASHRLSTGAIAGIAVVCGLVLIMSIVLGILFVLRKRRRPLEPKAMNTQPVELDAPGKDFMDLDDKSQGHLSHAELEGVEHKGHEIDGRPFSGQELGSIEQRFELDAGERRSPTWSSPISPRSIRHSQTPSSPISLMRERSDATKLHKREMSDPVSLTSAISESSEGRQRKPSEPISPTSQQTTTVEKHQSGLSDPISLRSERSASARGHHRESSDPISPMRARSDATRLHKRELSDPVSLMSEEPEEQEYQQDLFQELRSEDELVVLARGLGLLRVVTNLLHSYDAVGNNLVVIVGADDRENGWIGEALAEHAALSRAPAARGLSKVNTDMMSVGIREKMYSQGGIFSITSRILVVDLLSKLLNPETVTGLVVLHSERIVATSIEAFIIRIYRQMNKSGFLKAFSDNPEPFTTGFAPLASTMRNLFLRKPSLWPRFHVTVAKSLEGRKKAEVIELEVPMTDGMRDIQNAILECVEVSISELKKADTGLELDDWTLDSALHRSFDIIVRRQLDPIWHRVSYRTRQIVNDLSVLRSVLHALLTYDAVSFNKYLDTILAAHQPPPGSNRHNQSPWLFLDAANTIFETAKRRVYTGKPIDGQAPGASGALPDSLRPVLEEQPKWALLADVLEEIERDAYFNPGVRDDSNGTILIMCSDEGTCRQLREYLQNMHVQPLQAEEVDEGELEFEPKPSATFMMRRKLRNYLNWKREFARVSASLFMENQKVLEGFTDQRGVNGYRGKAPPNKRRRVRGGSAAAAGGGRPVNGSLQVAEDKESQVASLLADIQPTDTDSAPKDEVVVDSLDDMEDYFELYEMNDLVVVHPYDGDMDEHILEEVRPRYIIMYEPDSAFIRRVEVYRSSHDDRNVRVYFMYYGGSVEEQRYLSAVRREKDAFTRLIKEKGNMAVTITLDGAAADPQEQFLRTVNTRIAGGGRLAATSEPPRIVVDVREFRSSLPSLIHGRSNIVIPCMLTVADYVLTPSICIERKSVRDLISSFKNGRLFNQAETMLQHYKYPMLLIEFDQNKSFTLDTFGTDHTTTLSTASNPQDLQSKIALLTLAFPRLKIIWSSSPYQTAEIFDELKKQQEEPDPIKAVQIGLIAGEDPSDQSFNQTPQDMLRAVSGMTEKNLSRITLEVGSIADVSNMTEEELDVLIGKEAGRQVYRFFNRSVLDD